MSDNAPDPENLRALGERLDEVRRRTRQGNAPSAAPTSMGIAFRFAAEMVSALVVGGAIGWGLDWVFGRLGYHTGPAFMIVLVVLGAAAGIRNVMSAAKEINDQISSPGNRKD
ncbi:MAG: AtpZ/AtpI family protein [Alphaproteobacteria bacterium]|nr:AtpZ/AtpI family protein [Alphaproteobacteria bacterium]